MKLEKPAFPWGELFDIIVQGGLGAAPLPLPRRGGGAVTDSPTHLAIGFQKCCKCKHVLPLEEFYRPGDKHRSRRKSCNACAVASKAAYAQAQAEGLLHCTSCNQKKARSLFFDGDQRRQTCSDCRAKGRKKQVAPKAHRKRLYPGWESLTFGEFSALDPVIYPFRNVEVAA